MSKEEDGTFLTESGKIKGRWKQNYFDELFDAENMREQTEQLDELPTREGGQ